MKKQNVIIYIPDIIPEKGFYKNAPLEYKICSFVWFRLISANSATTKANWNDILEYRHPHTCVFGMPHFRYFFHYFRKTNLDGLNEYGFNDHKTAFYSSKLKHLKIDGKQFKILLIRENKQGACLKQFHNST